MTPTDRATPADEFAALARSQLDRLYSLARRLAGDGAEDLVQECLTRGWRAYPSLRDQAAGGAWLRSILLNVWRDQLRKRSRRAREVAMEDVEDFSLFRAVADHDPFPYSDSLHMDFLGLFGPEDVHSVLLELPVHYRGPLVLRYMEDLPTKEIARRLDLPLGTVLAQLHRGRKMLEAKMWDHARRQGLLERPEAVTPR